MNLPLRHHPLGEGAILFNERTWRTHVLTPAAAIIYDALLETSNGAPVTMDAAIHLLRQELDVNPDTPEIRRLLATLKDIGVIV